jgi:hypothetical protein
MVRCFLPFQEYGRKIKRLAEEFQGIDLQLLAICTNNGYEN